MHNFVGKWITDDEFFNLKPRNVFHKQLEVVNLPCDEHRNRHILFRKEFEIQKFNGGKIYISADDYYKLYIKKHCNFQNCLVQYLSNISSIMRNGGKICCQKSPKHKCLCCL